MAVNILDTGKAAEFTIEVDYKGGGKLVTTGNASQVGVIGDWTGTTGVNLEGVSGFKQEVVAGEKVEEVVAKAEEPTPPAKPRAIVPAGKNPYINASDLRVGADFDLASGETYEIDNTFESRFTLALRDSGDDESCVWLTEDDALLMAIRLLSTTPGGLRTSNGGNGFTYNPDGGGLGKDERAIGAAIFQLHCIVERRKHEKAMAEYEVKLAEFKGSEDAEDELNALVELALRECKAEFPDSYERAMRGGDIYAVVKGWPVTYPKHMRRVQETLRNLGVTAVHHLAGLVAEDEAKVANGAEADALGALALRMFFNEHPSVQSHSDECVAECFPGTLNEYSDKISKALEDLSLTARKYAEMNGVTY